MGKSVKKNVIYNSVFQILALIIPLLTAPYVSRVLGVENIGHYSYATAMVTYFVVIATLGSTIFGQRLIAFSRDNRDSMSEAFWNVFSFRLISGFIFLILYFLYLWIFNEANIVEILVSLNIINMVTDITWFFQGIEEFKKIIFRNMLVKLCSLIFVFAFVNSIDDTWIYTLICCGSLVISNCTLWFYLPTYIKKPKKVSPFINFKEMFLIFIPTIASQVYTILDKTMIGWITKSEYQNGCYEQSERLARAALTIVTSVGAVILPRVANLYKKGKLDEAKEYLYKAYRIVWALGLPIAFGLISVASYLMPIYLGDGYELSIILMQIFSWLVVFVSLAYVTGISYLIPTNQQNVYTVSIIAAAILNFGLNCFLIPAFGAIGAAFASISAELLGVIIQIGYCVIKKQLTLQSIFGSMWKYLISSIIMFIIVILVKPLLTLNVISLALLVVLGGLIYGIFLIIMKENFIIPEIIKLINKVKLR